MLIHSTASSVQSVGKSYLACVFLISTSLVRSATHPPEQKFYSLSNVIMLDGIILPSQLYLPAFPAVV